MKKQAKNYSMGDDRTLTKKQSKQRSFQPDVVDNAIGLRSATGFRYPSNPTVSGYNTGYHEAWGTTDTVQTVARRKVSRKKTTSTLPSNARSVFMQHKTPIQEELIPTAMILSDTLRTDTAQTVLSAPQGKAAGHTGSNVRTTNQAPAHDMLRHSFMRTLTDPDMDSEALELIGSAVAIASIAPGKVARTAQNSDRLKAGSDAKEEYEENRNEAKRRLHSSKKNASSSSIRVAKKHIDVFYSDLPHRSRQRGTLGSPIRKADSGPVDDILGGGYISRDKRKREISVPPKILPPVDNKNKRYKTSETGAYITQPFREKRR